MEQLEQWIGKGEDLSWVQMSLRAIIVFLFTLVLIRLGGVRIFGKRSSLDTIVMIILGAVLSRGIVGASHIVSVMAASTSMILLYKLLVWIAVKHHGMEKVLKGDMILLYSDGKIHHDNLEMAGLSERDLMQSLRLEINETDLGRVEYAYMENNGRISFVLHTRKEG